MAKIISQNINPTLNLKNIEDLESQLVEKNFGRPEDFIDLHIYDLNGNLLNTVSNFKDFNVEKTTQGLVQDLNLDPLVTLNRLGYSTGIFNIKVNIQKQKIFNTNVLPFKIKEISSTRNELKLVTINTRFNSDLVNFSRDFITAVQNSQYFRDFILDFSRDRNLIAVNIDIDRANPDENVLKIKLLEPLPGNYTIGDKLRIIENIVDPVTLRYDLGELPILDTTLPIKGPNFKIDTRLNSSVPTAFKSYDDILNTSSTSSYQKLISKLDGYEIPEIDYSYVRPTDTGSLDFEAVTPTHFENFVHFGSATDLLKNFEYKLKLIEIYDKQAHELNLLNTSTLNSKVIEASSSIALKKENLIQGFSGYEQFLYFESGAYSWPKRGNHPEEEPYIQAHTTSSAAKAWLGSADSFNNSYGGQLLTASIFDKQNPNRLSKLIPTFIGDKEENKSFEVFCNMIGEHFDPIWTHIKEITQTTDNSHRLGVSKDLVYYTLQNLGIEAFDQFENEDLVGYIFGQNLTPLDSSVVITGSNEVISKQDISKEIWKRLYHNAPYLLKTKGTERGLRALINCYGIPDTVLDVKEFGSSDPNRDEFKLYTYNKFTQVITGNSLEGNKKGMFIETEWTSSTTNAMELKPSASAKTVEFRIKPKRSGSDAYHLFSLTNHTSQSISGSDLHLILHPYTGSHDFFSTNDRKQYGKLDLIHMSSSILTSSGHSITSPIELITNGGFEGFGPELFDASKDENPNDNTGLTTSSIAPFNSITFDGTQTINVPVNQNVLTVGKHYQVSASIIEFNNGSSTSKIGFSITSGIPGSFRRTDNGQITGIFTATGTNLVVFANSGSKGTINNISVKEVLSDYSSVIADFSGLHGFVLNDGRIFRTQNNSGDNSAIHQTINVTQGKTYRISYEREYISGNSSTNVFLDFDGDGVNQGIAGADINTVGIPIPNSNRIKITDTFTAGYTGELLVRLYAIGDFHGYLDNLSVKEILHNSEYFPVYNGDFWNISLGTDGISGSDSTVHLGAYQANYLRDVLHYTSSVIIDEMTNAESFGSLHYSDAGNLIVNNDFTGFDAGLQTVPNWNLQDVGNNATFSTISNGIKVTFDSTPTNPFDVRVRQNLHNKLKLHHKYRVSLEARTTDDNLFINIGCGNGQNDQTNPQNIVDNGPPIDSSDFTYYQATFETTYLSDTNKTTDTQPATNDGNLLLHVYNTSPQAGDTFEIRNIQIEELGACSNAFFGGIKDVITGGIVTSSFYTQNNQYSIPTGDQLVTNGTFETNSDWNFFQAFGSTGISIQGSIAGNLAQTATVEIDGSNTLNGVQQTLNYTAGKAYVVTFRAKGSVAKKIRVQDNTNNTGGLKSTQTSTTLGTSFQTYSFTWIANANSNTISFARHDSSGNWSFEIDDVSVREAKDLFTLGYNGSMSEIRYYFGELLSHNTLLKHALEPLMYGGNSISSSFDHLVLRYPLSFELDLDNNLSSQIPSTDQQWNGAPSALGTGTTQAPLITPSLPLTGPITGGAILSHSLDPAQTSSTLTSYSGQPFASGSVPLGSANPTPPIFTVAGTPLLQSHHIDTDKGYLDGFTYFTDDDVELIVEEHHLPTPNTIGKSPVNNKVRIDSGSTDDDILSPDILSQLPSTERQVPDFSNIGVFLSPQNEINEDIIYTLGTFSLDEFLGDPREETSETYVEFKPLVDQYFKKLKRGTDRFNIWDFTRWVSFLDHTLFELIKKFTPQKAIKKTGVLIEPHFLERAKFRRYHPLTSRPEFGGTFQNITASFTKNNNISLVDGTSGSAVISYTAISSSNAHTNYNTSIDVAQALSGSNSWEQGPIVPILELVESGSFTDLGNNGNFTQAQNVTTPFGFRTKAGTSIGGGKATITALGNLASTQGNWALNQKSTFPHLNPDDEINNNVEDFDNNTGMGFHETYVLSFRAKQTVGSGDFQIGQGYVKIFDGPITGEFKNYRITFKRNPLRFNSEAKRKFSHVLTIGGATPNDQFELENISIKKLIDTSLEPRRFSKIQTGSRITANSIEDFQYGTINTSNELRPYVLTPRGNFLNAKVSKKVFKNITENKTFKLIDSSNNNLLSQFTVFNNDVSGTSNTIVFSNANQDQKASISFASVDTKGDGYKIKKGKKYRLTYTVSNFTPANAKLRPSLSLGNELKSFTTRTGVITDGTTFTETIIFDNTSTVGIPFGASRFFFESRDAFNGLTCTISNILLEEINPQRDTEFDDALTNLAGWNTPRYKGVKLTGAKINEYTEGDITYGLNPVVEDRSTALYFGKTLIGADGEDDDLVTIKNHSYIDIEKIMVIDKITDEIDVIDLKNENYDGINGYIANDFKDGSSFNIELVDSKITHQLRDSYKAKFNQGYLKKIIEHKGINGTGNIFGEGIQAGFIDTSANEPSTYSNASNTQNVFCYGNHSNTMNNSTLILKSNPLTRQIFPVEDMFGVVSFNTGSTDFVNSGMQQLGTFINSMLIPVASESQFRLFGTMNLGQKVPAGNYTASFNQGIKSISTFEIDLEKYDTTNSTQVSSSLFIDGVNRTIDHPKYYLLPIMQGPHDIDSVKTTGNGGATGHSTTNGTTETGVNLKFYYSGNGNENAIYQFSYLEKTNVVIADIDKPTELANDVGDKGYVLIPDNLDKDIKDNLDFYLDKAGLKEVPSATKSPPRGT